MLTEYRFFPGRLTEFRGAIDLPTPSGLSLGLFAMRRLAIRCFLVAMLLGGCATIAGCSGKGSGTTTPEGAANGNDNTTNVNGAGTVTPPVTDIADENPADSGDEGNEPATAAEPTSTTVTLPATQAGETDTAGPPDNPASENVGDPADPTPDDPENDPPDAVASAAPEPIKVELAQPPYPPVVIFSDQHKQSNRVNVGDSFPDLSLSDLNGKQRRLADLYGSRMTVVVVWTSEKLFAVEQFKRLNEELVAPFAPAGVSIVAIHVRGEASSVEKMAADAKAKATCLIDEDGEAFAKLATKHLPRTYVLDSAGKVLWFDIEYSRATRRELLNAIVYHLQQAGLLQQAGG